jgi:hypothetical protein
MSSKRLNITYQIILVIRSIVIISSAVGAEWYVLDTRLGAKGNTDE